MQLALGITLTLSLIHLGCLLLPSERRSHGRRTT